MNYAKVAALIGMMLLAFLFAWKWQEVRYLERESEIQQKAADDLKAEREKYDRERAVIEMARAKLIIETREKQNEIDRLSADVDAVRTRLRVMVKQQPGFTRCDAGGAEPVAAELDAEARRAYFDLRRGIVETEAWAAFCQQTVKAIYEKKLGQ